MRNLLLAAIGAVLAAAVLVVITLFTGLDHMIRSVVFADEVSFWTSIVIFLVMSIIGTALASNAK